MERHYYRIEIYTPKGSNDKTFYYSCVSRSELHEYINEKLEEVAWEGGRMFFEHHKDVQCCTAVVGKMQIFYLTAVHVMVNGSNDIFHTAHRLGHIVVVHQQKLFVSDITTVHNKGFFRQDTLQQLFPFAVCIIAENRPHGIYPVVTQDFRHYLCRHKAVGVRVSVACYINGTGIIEDC